MKVIKGRKKTQCRLLNYHGIIKLGLISGRMDCVVVLKGGCSHNDPNNNICDSSSVNSCFMCHLALNWSIMSSSSSVKFILSRLLRGGGFESVFFISSLLWMRCTCCSWRAWNWSLSCSFIPSLSPSITERSETIWHIWQMAWELVYAN